MNKRTASLLYDQLLIEPHIERNVKEQLKRCIVVEATNVSDYYFQGSDQEVWDVTKDFPTIAPPFPEFFLEFHAPAHIVSKVHGITNWNDNGHRPVAWGALCVAQDLEGMTLDVSDKEHALVEARKQLARLEELMMTFLPQRMQGIKTQQQFDAMMESLSKNEYNICGMHRAVSDQIKMMEQGDWKFINELLSHTTTSARWLLDIVIFWKKKEGTRTVYTGPLWLFKVPVDKDGSPFKGKGTGPFLHSAVGSMTEFFKGKIQAGDTDVAELYSQGVDTFTPMFHTALLAISFMHCKNVTLSEVVPPAPKPPTKKQLKFGHIPRQLATYHVLDIEPMKQVLKTEGQAEQVGLVRSLHICRGHFASYEEGKGLFGKYHGTYWIPQHVRGNQKKGIASKDYRIKMPMEREGDEHVALTGGADE